MNDKYVETGKANVRNFCEKLREEILSRKVDLIAEVKCPDGQYRNRPLLDVATVLEIMGNVLEKEMSRWNSHFLWKGVIKMLLQDNKERQVVLGQNPHTKEFTVAVYNKKTGNKRVYKTKKMMHKLICECI